jgi:hypothetical protein
MSVSVSVSYHAAFSDLFVTIFTGLISFVILLVYSFLLPRSQTIILGLLSSVADPGFGVFFTPGSGIRGGKNLDSDPGSGMNILDNFSDRLDTLFRAQSAMHN